MKVRYSMVTNQMILSLTPEEAEFLDYPGILMNDLWDLNMRIGIWVTYNESNL
jgi:hypothetical protein